MNETTASILRANLIESSHKLKILVIDKNNKTLFSTKNDSDYIYPRSSIKIFQAIPFIKSMAVEKFKLNSKQVALACSSHRGEKYHIAELKNWLKKINFKNNILKCGIHNPLNTIACEKILRSNIKVNELYNNCAGKHLAMITASKIQNYNIKNYLKFNHPHQIAIRDIFYYFSEKKVSKKNYGIDGCSAPQYSFRIKDIAKMLIKLTDNYNNKSKYSKEVKLLINSILENPKYIGGTDSLDSKIITVSNKKIFCKGGAEGVFLFSDIKKGVVGVVKVIDGNERVLPSVMYNLFKKLKIMKVSELNNLKKYYDFNISNHANIKIGSIQTNL